MLSVSSFPLPNFVVLYQYISKANGFKLVKANYKVANLSRNSYHYDPMDIDTFNVTKLSDESVRIKWWHPHTSLFGMQLVAIKYNFQSSKTNYHKLYSHSGTW